MPQPGQSSVTIKSDLVERVKKTLEKRRRIPRSVAEFVSIAIEKELERIEKEGLNG